MVWFMVFNATFNNISVISWWSVLLVEETGENYSTDLSQVTDKLYHINVVLCTQYRMKSSYNLEKFIFVNFIYLKKDYKRKRDHFDLFNRNFNCDNV